MNRGRKTENRSPTFLLQESAVMNWLSGYCRKVFNTYTPWVANVCRPYFEQLWCEALKRNGEKPWPGRGWTDVVKVCKCHSLRNTSRSNIWIGWWMAIHGHLSKIHWAVSRKENVHLPCLWGPTDVKTLKRQILWLHLWELLWKQSSVKNDHS